MFSKPITYNMVAVNTSTIDVPSVDDNLIYDLEIHKLFDDLTITLGASEIPRFSCACHKLNIVINQLLTSRNI